MSDPILPPEPSEGQPPAPPPSDYGAPTPPPPPPPSDYGAPTPPPAYAPPPPPPPAYAPPPPPGYAPPPAGYAPAPPAGYGPPAGVPGNLADWPTRAISGFIDYLALVLVSGFVEFFISTALGFLIWLVAIGWYFYNKYLEGQTGQSYGKKIAGTRLVRAQDGGLLGGGMGALRGLVHILDALPCYVGFLWPLWDAQRQTFADKIMGTYVVKV